MRTVRVLLFGLVLTLGVSIASAQGRLVCLTGLEFDMAYMSLLNQQSVDILNIATLGALRTDDPAVKDFSNRIIEERAVVISQLAGWYPRLSGGHTLAANPQNAQGTMSYLSRFSGRAFDQQYALVMSQMMRRSQSLADLGRSRAALPELREQAETVSRLNSQEAEVFRRWLQTGLLIL